METKSNLLEQERVPWYGYVALFTTILFLSGIFQKFEGPLAALDFTNILGQFGALGTLNEGAGTLAANFRGTGGTGARDSLLFILWLAPSVMLAFGVIEICTNLQGLKAAQKLLTPIMRPILGLSGATAIGLVASFTSADAGSAFTKTLYDNDYLNDAQRLVFVVFQFSAPALVVNYFSLGAALMGHLAVSPTMPILLIIVMKFAGANLCRLYVKKAIIDKKEVLNG